MLRFITCTLLLIAFAIQSFHKGGIVMDYYTNSSAYAKNCVNKAKPVLKCNGTCQMAKKILEQQKKDEQAPEGKMQNKFQSLWYRTYFATLSHHYLMSPLSYNSYSINPGASINRDSIFHPPCLI
jgi:hypothetical protein